MSFGSSALSILGARANFSSTMIFAGQAAGDIGLISAFSGAGAGPAEATVACGRSEAG